ARAGHGRSGHRVVIGDREHLDASLGGALGESRGRIGAVGGGRVAVQLEQHVPRVYHPSGGARPTADTGSTITLASSSVTGQATRCTRDAGSPPRVARTAGREVSGRAR